MSGSFKLQAIKRSILVHLGVLRIPPRKKPVTQFARQKPRNFLTAALKPEYIDPQDREPLYTDKPLGQHAPAMSSFRLEDILTNPFALRKKRTVPTCVRHELSKGALLRLVLATSKRRTSKIALHFRIPASHCAVPPIFCLSIAPIGLHRLVLGTSAFRSVG